MTYYTAVVKCCYCKAILGEKGGFTEPHCETHGICDACMEENLKGGKK